MKTLIENLPNLIEAKKRTGSQTVFKDFDLNSIEQLKKLYPDKKFYIKTYGCQANVRDSETMCSLLNACGYEKVDDVTIADIIIINTCAVRENAEDKVYGEVGNLKALRRKNKNLVIALCGCMVEQPTILEKCQKMFPEINLFYGTHEIPLLPSLLFRVYSTLNKIISIKSFEGEVCEIPFDYRNNRYQAFVNIMYGCNKFCTYCIVPYARGKQRSRKIEDIINEVRLLKKLGYQEITLLGQNVNAYGKDLNQGKDFADLLEEVALMGIPRIRFTTSHPYDFSSKMIQVIKKYDNIMKCIHLPVQSGNTEILKIMGRRYTREHYLSLVKEMRKEIPNLKLSTDIIVGFPNETQEQFNDTLSLVDIVKFESAFTFIFSPRNGTPAAKMVDEVPYSVKSERFKELVKHLEINIEKDSLTYVGNTYKVLVEGVSKTNESMYSGYTESNKLVHFVGNSSLIGKIVDVKITQSHTYSLIGELVK